MPATRTDSEASNHTNMCSMMLPCPILRPTPNESTASPAVVRVASPATPSSGYGSMADGNVARSSTGWPATVVSYWHGSNTTHQAGHPGQSLGSSAMTVHQCACARLVSARRTSGATRSRPRRPHRSCGHQRAAVDARVPTSRPARDVAVWLSEHSAIEPTSMYCHASSASRSDDHRGTLYDQQTCSYSATGCGQTPAPVGTPGEC